MISPYQFMPPGMPFQGARQGKGPWLYNGNYYLFTEPNQNADPLEVPYTVAVFKSTDNGISWSLLSGVALTDVLASITFAPQPVIRSGDALYFAWWHIDIPSLPKVLSLKIGKFDLTTETWTQSISDVFAGCPTRMESPIPFSTPVAYQRGNLCIGKFETGTLVILYVQDIPIVGGGGYCKSALITFDPSTSLWGTPVVLSNISSTFPISLVSEFESNNRIYCFLGDNIDNGIVVPPSTSVYVQSYTDGVGLGVITLIDNSTPGSSAKTQLFGPAINYDSNKLAFITKTATGDQQPIKVWTATTSTEPAFSSAPITWDLSDERWGADVQTGYNENSFCVAYLNGQLKAFIPTFVYNILLEAIGKLYEFTYSGGVWTSELLFIDPDAGYNLCNVTLTASEDGTNWLVFAGLDQWSFLHKGYIIPLQPSYSISISDSFTLLSSITYEIVTIPDEPDDIIIEGCPDVIVNSSYCEGIKTIDSEPCLN